MVRTRIQIKLCVEITPQFKDNIKFLVKVHGLNSTNTDEYKILEAKVVWNIVLWNDVHGTYKTFFSVTIIRK